MYRYLIVIAILLAGALMLTADELVLKNGDRLSGHAIISTDFISLHSKVLGNLKVSVTEVRTIRLEQPIPVAIAGSSYIALSISFDNGDVFIETETGEKLRGVVASLELFTASENPQHCRISIGYPPAKSAATEEDNHASQRAFEQIENCNGPDTHEIEEGPLDTQIRERFV